MFLVYKLDKENVAKYYSRFRTAIANAQSVNIELKEHYLRIKIIYAFLETFPI